MYQILALQESERGCLTEIITCNNLAGHYMPLQITFLQKNMKLELKNGTSSSSIYTCQPSGQSLYTVVLPLHSACEEDPSSPTLDTVKIYGIVTPYMWAENITLL
jgi:hypothetical protein